MYVIFFKNGKDKDPYIYNSGTIKDFLKPVKYVEIDEKGRKREYPFFEKWSLDCSHSMKRKYDFIPFNMTPPDTDVFNMFLG